MVHLNNGKRDRTSPGDLSDSKNRRVARSSSLLCNSEKGDKPLSSDRDRDRHQSRSGDRGGKGDKKSPPSKT